MNHEMFVFKNVLKNTCVFNLRLILDIFEYSEMCELDNINLFIGILNQKSYMYFRLSILSYMYYNVHSFLAWTEKVEKVFFLGIRKKRIKLSHLIFLFVSWRISWQQNLISKIGFVWLHEYFFSSASQSARLLDCEYLVDKTWFEIWETRW